MGEVPAESTASSPFPLKPSQSQAHFNIDEYRIIMRLPPSDDEASDEEMAKKKTSKLPTTRKKIKAQIWKANPTMEKDFIAFCIESASLYGYKESSLRCWASVITQLNKKYKQNFDQKALKNKWCSLKNGYILWRSLTCKTSHGRNEDGIFNWSDEVWEAAVEKNKKVAKFRLEPLKHFKELELLFECTFATGEDEFNPMANNKTSKLPTTRKKIKAQIWKANPTMEKDFIAFCIESASLHGYKGSSLKYWASVITQLNTKYKQNFDQKALKNKWCSLKNGYVLWRSLTYKTSHGRNEDGTFNWSDEVWKAAVEKNKKVAKFRLEPLKHFKELELLFECTFATGEDEFNLVRDDNGVVEVDAMNVDLEDKDENGNGRGNVKEENGNG